MSDSPQAHFSPEAEASHVSLWSAPGAVFLRLRQEHPGEPCRRMFVELTPEEARRLRRELDMHIAGAVR
ncbi:MAG TPA: hypothetical protein VHY76_13140 [Acetobacteraceae bacterium]|nr:hypothetical protein [Acetobacteraceae bacterium]